MKLRYFYLFVLCNTLAGSTPVVDVCFSGLFGNNIWQYCVGKIIAEQLGYRVYSSPLYGFPDTYSCQHNRPLAKYPTQRIVAGQDIDIAGLVSNRKPRNIRLEGYFQRYHYLKPYAF